MTDRSSDTSRFDPRFDPAFQPGYDPRNDPSASARAVPARSAGARPTGSAALAPLDPSARRDRNGSGQHDDSGHREDGDPFGSDAADGEQPLAQATQRTGVNPFVLSLWVVSVLSVVLGVGILRWVPVVASDLSSSTDSQYDFYFLQGLVIGAPIFIALGVTTAVGILFLYAIRWSKRPVAAE